MQGIPPADVVSAFQAGLDYCEKCIPISPVLRCFDDRLNEVPQAHSLVTPLKDSVSNVPPSAHSLVTPLRDTTSNGHCEKRSLGIDEHCPDEGSWQTESSRPVSSYYENKSSRNIKHSASIQPCCSEAGDWRQSLPATCNVVSSSAEPRTDVVDLNDDVRWFFEDTSDTVAVYKPQTVGDVPLLRSPGDKVIDNDSESDDRRNEVTPQICGDLSFPKCVCSSSDVCNEDDWRDCSESLFNSQESSTCSASETDDYASHTNALEHCMQESSRNAVKPNSNNCGLSLAQKLRETDKEFTDEESVSTLSPAIRATVPDGLPSSLPVADTEKLGSCSKVVNSHSLRYSRVLCRSRHFQSVQSAACHLSTTKDNMSDEARSDNACDANTQSLDVLLSKLSHGLKSAEVSESDRLSEIGQSCVSQQSETSMMSEDGERGYFKRLEAIGMLLSHGDDELMRLAIEICHRQQALNPTHTWFAISVCACGFGLLP